MKFERITEIYPAWDKRNPDPKKNYGIHGVEIRMVLKGPKGATQFLWYTNIQLPHVRKETLMKHVGDFKLLELFSRPMGADVGYHSPKPLYEEQKPMDRECPYVEGGKCYYDGSSLYGQEVGERLVAEGGEAVWKVLEDEYQKNFGEDGHDEC